jgi:hypothetical protein
MEDFLGDSDQHKGIQPSKQQPVTVAWISGFHNFSSVFSMIRD